jgi:hypothetical protein
MLSGTGLGTVILSHSRVSSVTFRRSLCSVHFRGSLCIALHHLDTETRRTGRRPRIALFALRSLLLESQARGAGLDARHPSPGSVRGGRCGMGSGSGSYTIRMHQSHIISIASIADRIAYQSHVSNTSNRWPLHRCDTSMRYDGSDEMTDDR